MNFIHPNATISNTAKVWHFAVIHNFVILCDGVNIGSRAELSDGCVIGKDTRIGSGVFLPPNSIVGQRVFIGPNTTFTDDKRPKAGNKNYKADPPMIEDDASIGAGCVILPGVRIGKNAVIGAGSVVAKDVPAGTVVYGDAATIKPQTAPPAP